MNERSWTNPPLAYVVAGVTYDQILGFEAVLAGLQTRLRPVFPGYAQESIELVQQTKIGHFTIAQERHVFRRLEGDAAVTIGDQGAYVVCTRYADFDSFVSSYLKPVLDALQHVLKGGPLVARRYGLRYIDRILPSEHESPEDYVSEHLRHDLADQIPGSRGAEMGLSLFRCRMDQGSLDFRFYTGNGRPPLPTDILPSPIPDDMPIGVDLELGARRTGVIDSDRFVAVNERMDAAAVVARFRELHDDLSIGFKTIVSDHALKVWGCVSKGGKNE